MPSRWLRSRNVFRSSYDFTQLIDRRVFSDKTSKESRYHIICDIDKTYLETNFENVFQIVRTAFEDAAEKITVRGASDVLTLARWGAPGPGMNDGFPRPLHFVSASPPQMRSVLEEKLFMDGLDWDTDTFKNQAYNIRKGRMDLLRHHIAYKSSAILRIMAESSPRSQFFLIGDNAEFDAYIYTGIDLFVERRLTVEGYCEFLKIAGVEDEIASDFAKTLVQEPENKVKGIFIRKAPNYPYVEMPPLSDFIFRFDNFFEASLLMMQTDLIAPIHLWKLCRTFHNQYGVTRNDLTAYLRFLQPKSTLGDKMRQAVADCFERLTHGENIEPSDRNLDHLDAKDLTQYRQLTQQEILHLARKWADRIGTSNRG